MKWGEFKFEDYGHDNPEYIVCFTHSEDFSVEDFTEAIEAHEDFVECAIVIDPEEDDQYEGVFSSCPSYRIYGKNNFFQAATKKISGGKSGGMVRFLMK